MEVEGPLLGCSAVCAAVNANGTLSACADASNNLFIHSYCGERSTWQLTHTDITLLHRELQSGASRQCSWLKLVVSLQKWMSRT